jgi:hypothetical protein
MDTGKNIASLQGRTVPQIQNMSLVRVLKEMGKSEEIIHLI